VVSENVEVNGHGEGVTTFIKYIRSVVNAEKENLLNAYILHTRIREQLLIIHNGNGYKHINRGKR